MLAMSDIQTFSASELGRVLRRERRALGLTQQELATRAGCRRETIIEMESGANISLYTLMAILGALGKGLAVCDARVEFENLAQLFADPDDEPRQAARH